MCLSVLVRMRANVCECVRVGACKHSCECSCACTCKYVRVFECNFMRVQVLESERKGECLQV